MRFLAHPFFTLVKSRCFSDLDNDVLCGWAGMVGAGIFCLSGLISLLYLSAGDKSINQKDTKKQKVEFASENLSGPSCPLWLAVF